MKKKKKYNSKRYSKSKKEKIITILPNGNKVTDDGSIIIKNYVERKRDKNYCECCNHYLTKDDKYCPYCGTKKGKKGGFAPNDGMLLYGPPIAYFYRCKKCKHMWIDEQIGYSVRGNYCPKCGTEKPNLYYEKGLNFYEDFADIKNPTIKEILAFKINNLKRNIIKYIGAK